MSWLYSRALVGEYLQENCLDGELCAQSSVTFTPQRFWYKDKMMGACPVSPFGQTYQLLTGDRGEDLLMWYREDFLAKTSQKQGKEKGLRVHQPKFRRYSLLTDRFSGPDRMPARSAACDSADSARSAPLAP